MTGFLCFVSNFDKKLKTKKSAKTSKHKKNVCFADFYIYCT